MSTKKYFDSDDEFEGFEVLVPDIKDTKKAKNPNEDSDIERALESSDESTHDDDFRSESDSEPDSVGFDESKTSTLERVKQAMKQIESDKRRTKLKRKERNDLFKLQKQKKLEGLAEKKLSAEFLDDVCSADKEVVVQSTSVAARERLHDSDADDREVSDEEEDTEYIAINQQIKVEAVCGNQVSKSSFEKAADFRRNWLYGNRLKRQTVDEMRAQRKQKGMLKMTVAPRHHQR